MVRYVYSLESDINFEWKFWFAKQPSDFGEVLEIVLPKYTTRYRADDGEVVRLAGDKKDIIRDLILFLKTAQLPDYDFQMLQALLQALERAVTADGYFVEGWFFVEY